MQRTENMDHGPVTGRMHTRAFMKITFNGTELSIASIEELGSFLDELDLEERFEFWISAEEGPSMCMLRDGERGWLMYLHFDGDSGLVTKGPDRQGTGTYKLSNGQIDEYPLSWCVELEQCYKAIAYFFVNDGARYDLLAWQAA
jgi:hypothetical protein